MEDILFELNETEDKEMLIDEIMTTYGQEILQLVFSYVNNKTVAEDLTQDIFVKCYRALHSYNKKSKLKTWLWRIAINHCKDYLKSWYYRNVCISENVSIISAALTNTVEQTVIQNEEDTRLIETVMRLPIKYREVIYLFYFEEMLIKEIAEVTGVKVNTVKTRLKRAKELLKAQLEG